MCVSVGVGNVLCCVLQCCVVCTRMRVCCVCIYVCLCLSVCGNKLNFLNAFAGSADGTDHNIYCLFYTSDAAYVLLFVDLGDRRLCQ